MTSVLETLSIKELYTRKKNLIFQLEKIDEELKNRILENDQNIHMEISPYLNKDIIEPIKKIIIKKESTENNNETPHIIRKITVKIKK
jgi:hypothetical protein